MPTVKSAAQATFDTTGGNNLLNISVHGDALPVITLTPSNTHTAATLASEINTALASTAHGLLAVSTQGNRVVISCNSQPLPSGSRNDAKDR